MNRVKSLRIGDVETRNNIFMAPMAGITDLPYREICHAHGAGLVYTEMVSAKGMWYDNKNTNVLLDMGDISGAVQMFGSEPEIMAKAAEVLDKIEKIAIIDINMGCPAPKIVKNGEGSALMARPKLVGEIVSAVSAATCKPVTVKIRKGFGGSDNAVEIAQIAEANGAKAVTVHGRTREQYYQGEADWSAIARVKRAVSIPVIGNGDVLSPEAAKRLFDETGCDGVMVARGAQGNPWLFKRITHYLETGEILAEPTDKERVDAAIFHMKRLIDYKGDYIGIREARKHVCWYIKGLRGAPMAKTFVNKAETMDEMTRILIELI